MKSSFSTKEIKEHINREQIKWLKERDACGGNMNCLNGVYQTRLQNLEGSFEVNPFGGVWSADDVARLVIYRPVAGPYFVAIHASDPQAGAWTCDVEGRASIQHGKMILSNQGKKITITHSNRDRLNIPLSDENLDSNDYFCGLNGGFTFEYIRVHNR